MTMEEEKYSVSWDAYQKSICSGLSLLQQKGEFVDMTLAADGHHVKVHQMVLSLVSPYIRDLISSAACPHPVIFLNRISYETLQSLLQYAYTGEVVVSNDKIQEFLSACKDLHIRGLEDMASFESKSTCESPYEPEDSIQKTETKSVPKNRPRDATYGKPVFVNVFDAKQDDSNGDCSNDCDDGMDVYDNDELLSTVQNIEEQHERIIKKTTDSALKFTVSNVGSLQLVLNRYLYNLRHIRKNNESMWRCNYYPRNKCLAFIIVKGSKVLKRACAHNHPYHDTQILKRLRNHNMYSTMHDAQRAIEKRKKEHADSEVAPEKKTSKNTRQPKTSQTASLNDGETE